MSDENTQGTDNDQQTQGTEQNRSDNRFKDLSDKYANEAEARKKAEQDKASAEREVAFYKGFTPLTSKYQNAGEFQDKIREKVMAGYDVEDATVAVLNKEGKLTAGAVAEAPRRDSPVGGSATTTLRSNDKNTSEMNSQEKREALIDLERESGGLSSLFNRSA